MGLNVHERKIGSQGEVVYDVYGTIRTDAELDLVHQAIAPHSTMQEAQGGLTGIASRHFFYCPLEEGRREADVAVQAVGITIGSFVSYRTASGTALLLEQGGARVTGGSSSR